MNKGASALGLLLVLIVCLLVSCVGGPSTPVGQPLKVEWSIWQGDYTLLVANQMGFFQKHGVNLEPVRYESSAQAIPDLAGAKLDGGLFSMSEVLLAAGSADLKAVLVSESGGQYSIIASPDIQSVQALRGKRIGLNLHSSSEMFVTSMLKSGRMTSNDVTYVEMSPDQILKAIPGQIDAGLVWEPFTSNAIQQGKSVVYQSEYDSSLIPRMLVFRKALVDQRPNDIRAFILAWEEAVNYRINNPQESLAIISKAAGLSASDLKLSKDTLIYTIKDNTRLFGNTQGTDPSSIYFIARSNRSFLITMGYITNPPDVGTLLDSTYFR